MWKKNWPAKALPSNVISVVVSSTVWMNEEPARACRFRMNELRASSPFPSPTPPPSSIVTRSPPSTSSLAVTAVKERPRTRSPDASAAAAFALKRWEMLDIATKALRLVANTILQNRFYKTHFTKINNCFERDRLSLYSAHPTTPPPRKLAPMAFAQDDNQRSWNDMPNNAVRETPCPPPTEPILMSGSHSGYFRPPRHCVSSRGATVHAPLKRAPRHVHTLAHPHACTSPPPFP